MSAQFADLQKGSIEISKSLPKDVWQKEIDSFMSAFQDGQTPYDLDAIAGFVKCPQCAKIEVTYYAYYPQALSCGCKVANSSSGKKTVTIDVQDLEVWTCTLSTISNGFDLGKKESAEKMLQSLIKEMESHLPTSPKSL